MLGVPALEADTVFQSCSPQVLATHPEHLFGQIDGGHLTEHAPGTQLNGDLRRARAHVQDVADRFVPVVARTLYCSAGEKVSHKDAADGPVVHCVIVSCVLSSLPPP